MSKPPRTRKNSSYRTVGKTYDGVDVIAPKTKSKTFTAAEVRRAIEKALEEVSAAQPDKSLRDSDALRVRQRADGRLEVRKPGAKRASAVKDTQAEAIARAHEHEPGKAPIAKRVRRRSVVDKGTWREA